MPKWFKLENYAFSKNLNSLEWLKQFWTRGYLRHQAFEARIRNEVYPPELKAALQASRENPNTDVFIDKRLSDYCKLDSALNILKKNSDAGLQCIKSITIRDYLGYKYLLQPEKAACIEEWHQLPENMKKNYSDNTPWFDDLLHKSFRPGFGSVTDTITIQLGLPDSFLIEQFKNYLATKRKHIPEYTTKHFRETDFNHWIELGILPYLDLIIWEAEENVRFSYRVLADAIYPHGDMGEETIRKTVVPLIEVLFSNKSMLQLAMQAAAEIAEKNSN